MPKDTFSIVIACSYDADALSATLQAIGELDYPPGFDVFVIDDGRYPDRETAIRNAGCGGNDVRYMGIPGTSRPTAWNLASTESTGEYVAFIEDGCLPTPGWLSAFRRAFDVWNVGVAGGPELPSKKAGILGRSLGYVLTSFVGSLGLRAGSVYFGRYYPKPWNMAARRESIRLSGGFSDISIESAEVPMIHRMAKIGYKAAYAPDALVYRNRAAGLPGFVRRSFLLAVQRGLDTPQTELRNAYTVVLVSALALLALVLYAGTHALGRQLLGMVICAYAVILGLSGLHAVATTRSPASIIAVPLLTTMHHGAHIAGYIGGLLGGLLLSIKHRALAGGQRE